ncbi:MAG: ABC transporter substrate-binding protein [Proteobacteria bacterium]|nr:ABC transporter substrate-binding protein [Pseudomonadota bacterium]
MKKHIVMLLVLLCISICYIPVSVWGATEVRIAHSTWVGYGPLYIARSKGFFEKQGLKVELPVMEERHLILEALSEGKIDGYCGAMDQEVMTFSQGAPIVVVLALDESLGGDGIISSKAIKSVRQLKGKTIGLDKSSTSYFFFLSALQQSGLSEGDMTINQMSAGDAGSAFMAGDLDAAVTWEPWLTMAADRPDTHVLVDTRKLPATIVDVLVLRRDFAQGDTRAVTGLIKAWYEAVKWFEDNREAGYALMAEEMNIDASKITSMVSGVSFYGADRSPGFFRTSGSNTLFGLAQRAARFWQDRGLIEKPVDIKALIDPEFVGQAGK